MWKPVVCFLNILNHYTFTSQTTSLGKTGLNYGYDNKTNLDFNVGAREPERGWETVWGLWVSQQSRRGLWSKQRSQDTGQTDRRWPLAAYLHTQTHSPENCVLKKHRLPHTCISQQLVVSLQHRQVGSAPALCPSLCAPPDPTPVSVLPKPHLTSWDNRWKASWERAASVTCWPDMDWHNSWGYNLLSADRRTESSVWKLLYDWNKRGVSGFKFAQWTRVTPL